MTVQLELNGQIEPIPAYWDSFNPFQHFGRKHTRQTQRIVIGDLAGQLVECLPYRPRFLRVRRRQRVGQYRAQAAQRKDDQPLPPLRDAEVDRVDIPRETRILDTAGRP